MYHSASRILETGKCRRVTRLASKWTNVSDGIPPVSSDRDRSFFERSDNTLCQDGSGKTFIGYVKHDDEFEPEWFMDGKDMYELPGVVRWIFLKDVLGGIS